MMRVVLAVAVMLTALDAAAGQQAPRPLRDLLPGRPGGGSGVITGRVTAVDSGVPLRQAIVSASGIMGAPRETVTVGAPGSASQIPPWVAWSAGARMRLMAQTRTADGASGFIPFGIWRKGRPV